MKTVTTKNLTRETLYGGRGRKRHITAQVSEVPRVGDAFLKHGRARLKTISYNAELADGSRKAQAKSRGNTLNVSLVAVKIIEITLWRTFLVHNVGKQCKPSKSNSPGA